MNRIFIALVIALLSFQGAAAANSELISQADSAYNADDFQMAAQLYLGAIKQEGPSAKLYYNLGNSYYRLGQNGKAILSYERALRLDPTDEDARTNLEFVNSHITDRAGERGTMLSNSLDSAANAAHSNTWAWIAFACFALTVAGILVYLYVDAVALRKVGFFGGIFTCFATMAALFFAFRAEKIATAEDIAIVTSPSSILSTVPRTPAGRTQEAMLLHEGTRVQILDSVSSSSASDSIPSMWYDVQVDNAHRAWINAADVERVR